MAFRGVDGSAVVGTRERPAEYRQVLGSVTGRVARLADRPVLVVEQSADGA